MYEIDKLPQSIDIGFTGEHAFRTIQIDMTKWMALIPDGTPYIVHIRPGQSVADAYVATTTFEDNVLTWEIAMSDLGNEEGTGIAQVWLEDATGLTVNHRGKSAVFTTVIHESAGEATVIPSGQMDWEEQLDAKVSKSDVANNLTTTEEGKVLDARQGKALDDKKIDKPSGVPQDKYLKTNSSGQAVWDDAPSQSSIISATEAWLADHVSTNSFAVDDTLAIAGNAADSKKTGDEISNVKSASDRYGEVERFENWVTGHYYPNGSNVDTVDINNPSTSTNYSCLVIPCVPGELFEYIGESSNAARSVSFLSSADSSGNKLTMSNYNYKDTGFLAVAPADAKYVVVNRKTAVYCSFVRYNKRHTLQPGDNLTNITAEGTYFCTSAADSALITGRPEGMGALAFRLDVQKVRGVSNYFRQILTTTTTESKYVQIYIRIFTSLVGDWLLVYRGNQNFLDIKNLSLIENGTDLDDILAPGSYYCPNYSSAETLEHLPFFVDSGFSMYVVNSGSPSSTTSYIRQFIFANKKEFSSVYTRTLNLVWGEWQIMATADMVLSPYTMAASDFVPGARLQGTPKKTITVATNNVAHYWLQGTSTGDYLASHPIRIDDWRKLLMKTDADIIFLQECEDYIDQSRTVSAFDTLYKPFFDSDHNIDDQGTDRPDSTGRAHPSRRKILNRLGLNTEGTAVTVEPVDTSYQYDCYFSWCIVTLSGVGNLLLINMHNFAGKAAARVADRKNYLDELATFIGSKTYDYLIIAGDTNANNADSDYGNLLDFCEEIDAIPVNGGVIGWFGTSSLEEQARPYDNIIVSNNIRIEDINCDPMLIPSGQLHTDHTLVAAKISFM